MGSVKRGDRVNLNKIRRLYFFQGKEGINLRVGSQENAIIPETITDDMLKKINLAIGVGDLVLGLPPEKKVVVPEDKFAGDLLQNGRKKIEDYLFGLRRNKTIKGADKIEYLEKLLELEKAGKNKQNTPRISVIKKIEFALSEIGGVSPITEEQGEEVKISFTKDV